MVCIKKSEQKSIISEGTDKKPMSPSILSPKDERISIKIPKNTKIYDFLDGDRVHDKQPAWKRLQEILMIAEQNKEMYSIKIFDDFVSRLILFYPDKGESLDKLRPLIIRQILHGEKLTEYYYKILKEL